MPEARASNRICKHYASALHQAVACRVRASDGGTKKGSLKIRGAQRSCAAIILPSKQQWLDVRAGVPALFVVGLRIDLCEQFRLEKRHVYPTRRPLRE
jgi:hypothetical protein